MKLLISTHNSRMATAVALLLRNASIGVDIIPIPTPIQEPELIYPKEEPASDRFENIKDWEQPKRKNNYKHKRRKS